MGIFQREKNRTSTKKEWKHVGIAFLVLCVVSFGLSFRLWQDGIFYFDSETETVSGKVTDVIWSPERHNNYYHSISYHYSFNNMRYHGIDKIKIYRTEFQKGDEIEVQVLKRIPKISTIKRED